MQKAKRNRLIADYYDAVIEGKSAMTVEDVQIIKGAMDVGIELSNDPHRQEGFEKNNYYSDNSQEDRSRILEIAMRKFP